MRLHIGEFGVEQRLGAVAGDVLDGVDVLAPAVVPAARQPLGVLVGEHAALQLQHGARREVLRSDHLQRAALAAQLPVQQLGDVGIDVGERGVHDGRGKVSCRGHGA
jgi:hypothetical protein